MMAWIGLESWIGVDTLRERIEEMFGGHMW